MLAYYEEREQQLTQALAQEWIDRGQKAKQVEDHDAQIKRIEHRLDEITRMKQAEKSRIEEEQKRQAEKPASPDKDKSEIVEPCAPGEAAGGIQGDNAPPKE
jgi:ATPase subunit of ABC transporter with duplicated ATPase domains